MPRRVIRAVCLNKSRFTEAQAKAWVAGQGFDVAKATATETQFVFAQSDGAGKGRPVRLFQGIDLTVEESEEGAGQFELIDERFQAKVSISREAADDPKVKRLARLTYEFDCIDTVGYNRRIYPMPVFAPAVDSLNTQAGRGRVYGRLDHPHWDEPFDVTLSDAATRLVEVKVVGEKTVRVTEDVADNEYGKQLMSLLEVGGDVCISQRGLARWDMPNDEEKKRYGIGEDTVIEMARALRLVCYDNVASPGFDDAGNPAIEGQTMGPKELAEKWKKESAEAYALILAEGKAQGKTEATEAANTAAVASVEGKIKAGVDAALPEAVRKATESLTADLTKARADLKAAEDKLVAAKGGVEGMVKAGLIELPKSDAAESAKKITALESELKTAQDKVKALEADVKKATDEATGLKTAKSAAETAEKVRERYKESSPAILDLVMKAVRGEADEKVAMDKAAEKFAEIAAIIKVSNPNASEMKAPAVQNPKDAPGKKDEPAGDKKSSEARQVRSVGMALSGASEDGGF